jgi:hypothetical protein
MDDASDLRRFAPATSRNREPILEVLQQVLPPTGTILEISSGTGEHSIFFAPQLAPRYWLPSDLNPDARASIAAWQKLAPADRLYPPIELDASSPHWLVESDTLSTYLPTCDLQQHPITAIVNINMIHIAPRSAYLGLVAGARRILPQSGVLYLYGPFKQQGVHTSASNAAFDESLQRQNPEWGVWDLEEVVDIAERHNLRLKKIFPMPANNLSVVFQLDDKIAH